MTNGRTPGLIAAIAARSRQLGKLFDEPACNQALAARRLTVEERQARADVLKAAIVSAGAG